jgi:hypothetical protein
MESPKRALLISMSAGTGIILFGLVLPQRSIIWRQIGEFVWLQ